MNYFTGECEEWITRVCAFQNCTIWLVYNINEMISSGETYELEKSYAYFNRLGRRPTGGGFETFSWYFMRISAIALFFLAIIHLFLNHISTDVSCTSYQLIAARYANPYWRVYDWLLLTLALLH